MNSIPAMRRFPWAIYWLVLFVVLAVVLAPVASVALSSWLANDCSPPMRAIWKGSISFGLVHIPVAVYPRDAREIGKLPATAQEGSQSDSV